MMGKWREGELEAECSDSGKPPSPYVPEARTEETSGTRGITKWK